MINFNNNATKQTWRTLRKWIRVVAALSALLCITGVVFFWLMPVTMLLPQDLLSQELLWQDFGDSALRKRFSVFELIAGSLLIGAAAFVWNGLQPSLTASLIALCCSFTGTEIMTIPIIGTTLLIFLFPLLIGGGVLVFLNLKLKSHPHSKVDSENRKRLKQSKRFIKELEDFAEFEIDPVRVVAIFGPAIVVGAGVYFITQSFLAALAVLSIVQTLIFRRVLVKVKVRPGPGTRSYESAATARILRAVIQEKREDLSRAAYGEEREYLLREISFFENQRLEHLHIAASYDTSPGTGVIGCEPYKGN